MLEFRELVSKGTFVKSSAGRVKGSGIGCREL